MCKSNVYLAGECVEGLKRNDRVDCCVVENMGGSVRRRRVGKVVLPDDAGMPASLRWRPCSLGA